MSRFRVWLRAAQVAALGLVSVLPAHADEMPPWNDSGDVPVPTWMRSVAPNKLDAAIYAEPGKLEARRGSAQLGARLPLYGTRRANGCQGRWLNVGPLAWICSDVADYSGDDPAALLLGVRPWVLPSGDGVWPERPGARSLPPIEPTQQGDDGLPYRYFFAGGDGAYGYANLANALDDAPDQELEQGFAVAAIEEKAEHGEKWIKTKKGRWIALRELVAARPSLFHGELLDGNAPDFAWISADKANVYPTEKPDKTAGTRVRFERVKVYEEKPPATPKGEPMLRISADGDTPAQWMRARDLSRPRLVAPPAEIGGEKASERWIDVDLAQQTLVAYEGTKPVFATLVSTGKGPPKSDTATNPGVHRIWVKIFTTKMDNLAKDDVERHYALEDVPWVQFFDKAIALHGVFWHRDFGHVHSHGCVNLAPLDARWLFAFTGPHLPSGWTAVFPTKLEPGTVIRVR
ncbi:L,D-transpeptidase [Labilithrix luteola]|uniref:L,D-transpeptidase n=1 Tax=Labilithrix luteola TaxID=1391654 RepID=UPI0011BA4985|nr:L,D-transpeptidase [Labilithrix luteola]